MKCQCKIRDKVTENFISSKNINGHAHHEPILLCLMQMLLIARIIVSISSIIVSNVLQVQFEGFEIVGMEAICDMKFDIRLDFLHLKYNKETT